MDVVAEEILTFEHWRFDRGIGGLARRDANGVWLSVPIGSRAISILGILLDNPGELVPQDVIRRVVWPHYVEPNNLTVQIAALRRILDAERLGESCIQTVPGRGYRFIIEVSKRGKDDGGTYISQSMSDQRRSASSGRTAPRFSIAILPFVTPNGGRSEAKFAAAVTDKLTTDLCQFDGAIVKVNYHAGVAGWDDTRAVGGALRVRYIVNGRLHKLDAGVHVNVQLISTESSDYLWACRFDHTLEDPDRSQDEIVCRVKAELLSQILAVESTRSLRERPDNPDAMDLLLRARSLMRKHDQTQLLRDVSKLLEEALRLEPLSVSTMCDLARQFINRFVNNGEDQDNQDLLEQAMVLVTAAAKIEPNNIQVIFCQGYLARALGRWTEAIAFLQRLVTLSPNFNHGLRQLGFCKLAIGQPEAAIPLLEKSIYLDPLAPTNRYAYRRLSQAFLMLERDSEAIDWAQRALAEGVIDDGNEHAYCYQFMASALALFGEIEEARRALAEARRLSPFATVQTFLAPVSLRGLPHHAFVALLDRIRHGLRIAGMREYADEHASLGSTSNGELSNRWYGLTPANNPGAVTIRTNELVTLLSRRRCLLIDMAFSSCGRSLPNAIGLQGLGHGEAFSEGLQARLSRKIRELTDADRSAPIVVYCAIRNALPAIIWCAGWWNSVTHRFIGIEVAGRRG